MLSVGFGAGFMYEILQENSTCEGIKNDENKLLYRINEYQASCRELKNTGMPEVKKVGKDYILVIPNRKKNDYIVVGINNEKRPAVSWSGGDLKYRIEHACSKK